MWRDGLSYLVYTLSPSAVSAIINTLPFPALIHWNNHNYTYILFTVIFLIYIFSCVFLVATVTTVGYGDFSPSTTGALTMTDCISMTDCICLCLVLPGSQLFCIFYVPFGIIVIFTIGSFKIFEILERRRRDMMLKLMHAQRAKNNSTARPSIPSLRADYDVVRAHI